MLPSVNYKDADSVPQVDAPIALLQKKLADTTSSQEKQQYESELSQILQLRSLVDKSVDDILSKVSENNTEKLNSLKSASSSITSDNMNCVKTISKAFSEHCFKTASNQYAAAALQKLIKTCNVGWTAPEKTVDVIRNVCSGLERSTEV